MENIYEFLYEHYAFPQMASVNSTQQELFNKFISKFDLSLEKQIFTYDFLSLLRMQWGVEAFAVGIHLGFELAAPYSSSDFYDSLMFLLAKLDQPVT